MWQPPPCAVVFRKRATFRAHPLSERSPSRVSRAPRVIRRRHFEGVAREANLNTVPKFPQNGRRKLDYGPLQTRAAHATPEGQSPQITILTSKKNWHPHSEKHPRGNQTWGGVEVPGSSRAKGALYVGSGFTPERSVVDTVHRVGRIVTMTATGAVIRCRPSGT